MKPESAESEFCLKGPCMKRLQQMIELEDKLRKIQVFVEAQAEDESLWCRANYASEAYMQEALRRLHACIEGENVRWLGGGE